MAFVCFSGLPGLIDRVFNSAMVSLTRAPVNRVNVVQHKICGGIMIDTSATFSTYCHQSENAGESWRQVERAFGARHGIAWLPNGDRKGTS
jgi:hypothetical protein